MLLVLSNSKDATADFLCELLESRQICFIRFDTDLLINKVRFSYSRGVPACEFSGLTICPKDITAVWYRRPERLAGNLSDDSPSSKYCLKEWTEALEGFFAHIPKRLWINHPSSNVAASSKLHQLTVASSLGFKTPSTLVTQDHNALLEFFRACNQRIIAKPLSNGDMASVGDDQSLIYTSDVTLEDLSSLDELESCPTLFQQRIEKRCDVRITVVDRFISARSLVSLDATMQQQCDIRRENMAHVTYHPIDLPREIRAQILALAKHYELRFAAIDMAVSLDQEWIFFEVNPNGQWAWLDLCSGTDIAEAMIEAFVC